MDVAGAAGDGALDDGVHEPHDGSVLHHPLQVPYGHRVALLVRHPRGVLNRLVGGHPSVEELVGGKEDVVLRGEESSHLEAGDEPHGLDRVEVEGVRHCDVHHVVFELERNRAVGPHEPLGQQRAKL